MTNLMNAIPRFAVTATGRIYDYLKKVEVELEHAYEDAKGFWDLHVVKAAIEAGQTIEHAFTPHQAAPPASGTTPAAGTQPSSKAAAPNAAAGGLSTPNGTGSTS